MACTQEQRLFSELAEQTPGAVSVIQFVNIRETGGWSQDAKHASPKIAALLAAAHLPEPEPVPVVTYKSQGKLLILGPMDEAERAAGLLSDVLEVSIFAQGPGKAGGAQTRRYPVLGPGGRDIVLDFTMPPSGGHPQSLELRLTSLGAAAGIFTRAWLAPQTAMAGAA